MTIQTVIAEFSGYRGMGNPCTYQKPVLLPGDRIELSGWEEPVVGTVIESNGKLVQSELPIATPGGTAYTCGLCRVKKVWRGADFLDLSEIGLQNA